MNSNINWWDKVELPKFWFLKRWGKIRSLDFFWSNFLPLANRLVWLGVFLRPNIRWVRRERGRPRRSRMSSCARPQTDREWKPQRFRAGNPLEKYIVLQLLSETLIFKKWKLYFSCQLLTWKINLLLQYCSSIYFGLKMVKLLITMLINFVEVRYSN